MICELSSSVCEARDIAGGCPAFDDGAPGSILELVAAVLDFFLDAARMHDLDIVAVDLDLGAVPADMLGAAAAIVIAGIMVGSVVVATAPTAAVVAAAVIITTATVGVIATRITPTAGAAAVFAPPRPE